MKKLMLMLLLPTIGYATEVTSIELNNKPVSGLADYTDPTTHIAAPNTNGTHILNITGNGVTAVQTPNYGGSGLSQVSVNLNNLQTNQDTILQNNINNIALTPGAKGATGATGAVGPQGPQGAPGRDAIAPAIDPRVDVEVREYDAQHWSMSSFASFGFQDSTARYIVGQKLTLKLGHSYEETKQLALEKKLQALEARYNNILEGLQ